MISIHSLHKIVAAELLHSICGSLKEGSGLVLLILIGLLFQKAQNFWFNTSHVNYLTTEFFSSSSKGTENSEANEEYQNSSQESWVQRMLMALVGDSALFNTREGRAGKVHNFMLGLNLNSCYPLSPLADLLTQESVEEDELDAAVAG